MSSVTLETKNTSYEELEKSYYGFFAPAYKIEINNIDIFKEDIAIDSVSVDITTADKADTATFTIVNAYDLTERDFSEATNELIQLGNSVEVSMGYKDKLTPLFVGYITNVEFNFSQSDSPTITVTAMDISFLMMRSSGSEVFSNQKIDQLVETIGRQYGITSFEVSSGDNDVHATIAKSDETDHKFLLRIAKDMNCEFFVLGKKLYYRKINPDRTPVMTLKWGQHLQSFRVDHNLTDQVTKVVVTGNIHNSPDIVVKEATRVDKVGNNTKTGVDLLKKLGNFEEVIPETVNDEEEAQKIAVSRLQELSMKLVNVSGSCIGIPEIRPGRYIMIKGLSSNLDALYYIQASTHTIDGSGYVTNFKLQGNAV